MSQSSLCDYSDPYIPVSGTITITREENNDTAKQADKRQKRVIFKNCAPFADRICEINHTQIDNAKDIEL